MSDISNREVAANILITVIEKDKLVMKENESYIEAVAAAYKELYKAVNNPLDNPPITRDNVIY